LEGRVDWIDHLNVFLPTFLMKHNLLNITIDIDLKKTSVISDKKWFKMSTIALG